MKQTSCSNGDAEVFSAQMKVIYQQKQHTTSHNLTKGNNSKTPKCSWSLRLFNKLKVQTKLLLLLSLPLSMSKSVMEKWRWWQQQKPSSTPQTFYQCMADPRFQLQYSLNQMHSLLQQTEVGDRHRHHHDDEKRPSHKYSSQSWLFSFLQFLEVPSHSSSSVFLLSFCWFNSQL